MEKITYTNTDEESIVLSEKQPYMLTGKEGFNSVENDIISQKGYEEDGETFISQSLSVRNITLEGIVVGKTKTELLTYRREMIRIFNPKISGSLVYQNDNGHTKLIAYLNFLQLFKNKS